MLRGPEFYRTWSRAHTSCPGLRMCYHSILPSVFAHHNGNKCCPADGRHPPAPLPQCSCYQGEACCAAGSLGPRGTPWSRHIDQRQPRVARHGTGFGARRFMSRCSERDDSTAWDHLAGSEVEPLPVMAAGPCAGRGPTRAPDSSDNTSLRVVAPAPHHRIYKRTGRGAVRE